MGEAGVECADIGDRAVLRGLAFLGDAVGGQVELGGQPVGLVEYGLLLRAGGWVGQQGRETVAQLAEQRRDIDAGTGFALDLADAGEGSGAGAVLPGGGVL